MKKIIFLIILSVVLGGLVVISIRPTNDIEKINQTAVTLHPDVLPLYGGVTWGNEESSVYNTMPGVQVVSDTLLNITNIAEVTTPFEGYYRELLLSRGWSEDIMLAAGGPGSAVTAYTKNGQYIIVSYQSDFGVLSEYQPAQCPCAVQFSVFTTTESVREEMSGGAMVFGQGNTFSNKHVTERYVGQIDRVSVIFEHSDYTSYRLSTNDIVREGQLNTERGYKDDSDATVYVLNWRLPEGEQLRYVRLTDIPEKLFLLDTEQNVVSSSVLTSVSLE